MMNFQIARRSWIALSCVAACSIAGAQGTLWQNRLDGVFFPDNQPRDMDVDSLGRTYVVGYNGVGSTLLKLHTDGKRLWARNYRTQETAIGSAVQAHPAGGAVVVGEGTPNRIAHGLDAFVYRYDDNGDMMWLKRFNGPVNGDDAATHLTIDTNGDIYVAAYSTGTGGDKDFFLMKYSASGTYLWGRRRDGRPGGEDLPSGLALDPNGSPVLTGTSWDPVEFDANVTTLKYDPAGNLLWHKEFGESSTQPDYSSGLAIDSQGNVVVVGSTFLFGKDNQMMTLKYNSGGARQWVRTFGGTADQGDQATAVAIGPNNDVLIAGSTYNVGTGHDATIVRYTTDGERLWAQKIDNATHKDDLLDDIAIDALGNIFATGGSDDSGTGPIGFNMRTYKLDSFGNLLWTRIFADKANDYDRGMRIELAPDGNPVVSGVTTNAGGADFWTIKYASAP